MRGVVGLSKGGSGKSSFVVVRNDDVKVVSVTCERRWDGRS